MSRNFAAKASDLSEILHLTLHCIQRSSSVPSWVMVAFFFHFPIANKALNQCSFTEHANAESAKVIGMSLKIRYLVSMPLGLRNCLW